MGTARSIQTKYNGYYFRSMMEARWALYLDKVGINYMFEPAGYSLSNGQNYLPDFYLPDYQCFAEVKGGPLDSFDFTKAKNLVIDTQIPLIMLDGDPDYEFYEMIHPDGEGGIKTEPINIIPDPENKGSMVNNITSLKKNYEEKGYNRAVNAIQSARSERFGT